MINNRAATDAAQLRETGIRFCFIGYGVHPIVQNNQEEMISDSSLRIRLSSRTGKASNRKGGKTCRGERRDRPDPAYYFSLRKYWSVLLIQSARGGLKISRSTVSSRASALCGMLRGMVRTSPAFTTISFPSIQNFSAPSRM